MRIVMMGTGHFAEPTFEALLAGSDEVVGLVTQPDRAVGQERGSTRQIGRGMKTIALERSVPVSQPESINTPEGVAGLKELRPDLLVVAAYGQILSREVLTVPPRGGINVHASLLPKYRGAAPIAWAIFHGETITGVTIIKMSVSLDAGDMLAQEEAAIGVAETAGDVEARLAPVGARLAMQVIEQMKGGTVQGRRQDLSLVTKAPKLTKEHGVIDWNRSPEQICNHVRAMQPWPTAFTFWHTAGKEPLRLQVTQAVPFPVRYDPSVSAGTPFEDSKFPGSLFLTAGMVGEDERGVVEVRELQPASKRRMTAADFLHGRKPQPGDWLGPAL